MAKLVDLISTASIYSDTPEKTLVNLSRNLREHGLITSSGRGPGGAEMLPPDAVNLLIGMTAPQAKFAPLHVEMVRGTIADSRVSPLQKNSPKDSEEPLFGSNFGEDFESLICFAGFGNDQYGGKLLEFGVKNFNVSISRDTAMLFVEASIYLETQDSTAWNYTYHSPERSSHRFEPNFLNHVTIRKNLIAACAQIACGVDDDLPPIFTINEIDGGRRDV